MGNQQGRESETQGAYRKVYTCYGTGHSASLSCISLTALRSLMFSLDCTVTSQNGNLKADYFLSAQK